MPKNCVCIGFKKKCFILDSYNHKFNIGRGGGLFILQPFPCVMSGRKTSFPLSQCNFSVYISSYSKAYNEMEWNSRNAQCSIKRDVLNKSHDNKNVLEFIQSTRSPSNNKYLHKIVLDPSTKCHSILTFLYVLQLLNSITDKRKEQIRRKIMKYPLTIFRSYFSKIATQAE